MELKDIKLKKGMTKDEVNELTKDHVFLDDDIYLGNKEKHNWKCLCGNIIEKRNWDKVRGRNENTCKKCLYKKIELNYKHEVEKDGEYEYIRSYRTGSTLPNGKITKQIYIEVKHIYCGSIYLVQSGTFINHGGRCGKCCKEYKNSFAYHIEIELGLKLDDVWDFEKNKVNPYHIWKNMNSKVWVKCQEKDYHGSYEVICNNFTKRNKCPYCSSKLIHLYDSFGYKHFDKVCMNWHSDNKISPFSISQYSNVICKFKCSECGNAWDSNIGNITKGKWCKRCNLSKGEKKIKEWLIYNNIDFISEKEFDGLVGVGNQSLRYDFYLPKHNIVIEYQGEQHERYIKGFHKDEDSFIKQQEHDNRKREYNILNNIDSIEIWYNDFDNIDNILNDKINKE